MKYKKATMYMSQQIALQGKMSKDPAIVERKIYVHYTPNELADKGKTDAKVFHALAMRERVSFGATFQGSNAKNNICHQWKCLRYHKG